MPNNLYAIYGASGAGRGIMPLLRRQVERDTAARCVFIDDGLASSSVNGTQCMSFEQFAADSAQHKSVAIAIADSRIREKLAVRCEAAGIGFVTVKSDLHVCMDEVEIGPGAIFSPFTTITSNVRIGRHFHCNINAYVEHDCIIGDFVTFAPGVQCNGNVEIGDHVYVGAGAMIRQGTSGAKRYIGEGAVIGMGAVVLEDVPAGATVVGNPARAIGPADTAGKG